MNNLHSAPVIRKFKVENTIDPKEIRMATIMTRSLLDQLQLCVATGTPQIIFGQAPSSLPTFCPQLVEKESPPTKKRHLQDKDKFPKDEGNKKPAPTRGSIVNDTGKKIYFPKGLKNKYCSEFLDTNATCRHGENCNFIHAVWPTSFPKEDVDIIKDFVAKTEGLSFANKPNDKKVS